MKDLKQKTEIKHHMEALAYAKNAKDLENSQMEQVGSTPTTPISENLILLSICLDTH